MRDVLAGATRMKLTVGDLRGKPLKKRDRTLEKDRTVPVSSNTEPKTAAPAAARAHNAMRTAVREWPGRGEPPSDSPDTAVREWPG